MANSINMKKALSQDIPYDFESPNKMNQEDCHKIIASLSKEQVKQMQNYVNAKVQEKHLKGNGQFFVIRAYLYNNYIKPRKEKEAAKLMNYDFVPENKKPSLLDFLNSL